MKSSRVQMVIILAFALATLPARMEAAPQQEVSPPEGETLHILVGKSVVVNVQTPITRVLSSNPTVIETLATSPTQIVVEGKAAGSGSLILWDATERDRAFLLLSESRRASEWWPRLSLRKCR
jgi:Flp pilus assembly secretin CpaC